MPFSGAAGLHFTTRSSLSGYAICIVQQLSHHKNCCIILRSATTAPGFQMQQDFYFESRCWAVCRVPEKTEPLPNLWSDIQHGYQPNLSSSNRKSMHIFRFGDWCLYRGVCLCQGIFDFKMTYFNKSPLNVLFQHTGALLSNGRVGLNNYSKI